MIHIKNLTVKNFMSVGNATQGIDFDRKDLTLVLGENLDLGGDGSRNGTGKTTIINALSYALYGQALSNIRKDNLVNKTNGKNMLVSLDFALGNQEYKIESKYDRLLYLIEDKKNVLFFKILIQF
jgi:DNA repair exonuclease SbcCD ATPase subunit